MRRRPAQDRTRRRSTRSSPKNMALSPEDAAFVCEQFGIDPDRPLICQVSRFDPWKDPIGVIDAYRIVRERSPRCSSRWSARWRPTTPRAGSSSTRPSPRRRRPRHQDPQQPQQRRRDRGQRLPVAGRRLHPEVDPRGLRPDRHRGAVEGPADDRRRRRRHPAADRRRRLRLPRLLARGGGAADDRDPRGPRAGEADRPRRQGARPRALPHPAPAARLAPALQRPELARSSRRAAGRRG